MRWELLVLYIIAMLTIIVFSPIRSTGAEENASVSGVSLEIYTYPSKLLFNINNSKPGDIVRRTLSVENGGNVNVNYKTKVEFTNGSKKLFNQLLLQVTDGEHILYDGALSNFTGFDERQLSLADKEQFIFQVEFPFDSGNEFQGLATKFQIIVSADNFVSSNNASGFDSVLPKTGSFISPIALTVGGMLLIVIGTIMYYTKRGRFSFHLFNRGKDV